MIFRQLNPHACRTYLIGTEGSQDVVLVDPVLDHLSDYLDLLEEEGLSLRRVIDTHTHADHISGSPSLKDRTDCSYMLHETAPAQCAEFRVADARVLRGIALLAALAAWGALSAAGLFAVGPDTLLSRRSVVLGAASASFAGTWWLASRAVRARMAARLVRLLTERGLSEEAAHAVGRASGPRLVGEEAFTVFVVDGYSRLPAPVREGILEAMRQGRLSYAVTWILLDPAPPGLLRKDIARLCQSGGHDLTLACYDLQPLSPDERARVAEANGMRPKRAQCDDDIFAELRVRRAAEGWQEPDKPRTPLAA